jgi:methyl-accepting chemotaxis protein
MSKYHRPIFFNRKILVDQFQMRFVGVALCHFILIVMIFVVVLFAPIVIRLQSGDISSPAVQAAAHEFLALHENLWIPLAGAMLLLILHNILLTHRVAGPLYRFRRHLKAIGEGDLSTSIVFRKHDYLAKEAIAANEMVESLRDNIVRVEKQVEEMNWVWSDLRDGMTGGQQDKVDEMNGRITKIRNCLSFFSTSDDIILKDEITAEAPQEPVEINV